MKRIWTWIKRLPRWALAGLALLPMVFLGLRALWRHMQNLPSMTPGGPRVPVQDPITAKAAAERREEIRRDLVEQTEVIGDRYDGELRELDEWLDTPDTIPDREEP